MYPNRKFACQTRRGHKPQPPLKPREKRIRAVPEAYILSLRHVLLQCTKVGIPDASRALGLLRNRDWSSLYDYAEAVESVVYDSAAKHYAANQLACFIKKYPWGSLIPKMDPLQRALDKFDEAEEQCRKTNVRFSRRLSLQRSRFWPLLEAMKRYIYSTIGEHPDLKQIASYCKLGTGASVGVHGNATNFVRKVLSDRWSCTSAAFPYVLPVLMRDQSFIEILTARGNLCCGPHRPRDYLEALGKIIDIKDSNKLSFVPKTAKTHRAIAVEPLLNGYIQSGTDTLMRKMLARRGVDLTTQDKNRSLARIGSIGGMYSTIDLSSASDTVSTGVVAFLLPPAWFFWLKLLRSPSYITSKGDSRNFHKFSSMGNNFTFPLETLIFKAAMHACMRGTGVQKEFDSAVYGDDIIVPTAAAPCLMSLLRFLGFTPNPDKTFVYGPFRESCGSDWYSGEDVRPVVLDLPLRNTGELMILHNACLRSERTAEFFRELLPQLRSCVPETERFLRPNLWARREPAYAGMTLADMKNLDGAFTVPLDTFMSSRWARWNRDLQTWSWKEFLHVPVVDRDIHKLAPPSTVELARYHAFLSGCLEGEVHLRYTTKRLVKIRN